MQQGDILVADANTGWTMHEAARVVSAVREVDVYIEQPCPTYENVSQFGAGHCIPSFSTR